MGKVLIGVVIGIVLSGVVTSIFNSTTEDSVSASRASADTNASASDDGISESEAAAVLGSETENLNGESLADPSRAVSPSDTNSGATDALLDPIGSGESLAARETRLREEMEQAQDAVDQASSELQQLMIERMLADNPVVSPAPLPPEFDWVAPLPPDFDQVSEELLRYVFHERLQREPIDGAWSASTESELLQFVYDRPAVVEKYGPPTIRCHTRSCEVLFTSTSGDGAGAEAAVRQLHEESLDRMPEMFDCVDNPCWAEANYQNGVTTIYWGVRMNRTDRQPQSLLASASE